MLEASRRQPDADARTGPNQDPTLRGARPSAYSGLPVPCVDGRRLTQPAPRADCRTSFGAFTQLVRPRIARCGGPRRGRKRGGGHRGARAARLGCRWRRRCSATRRVLRTGRAVLPGRTHRVLTTSIPAAVKTASKAVVNLASRSRMRNRNRRPASSRSIARFRASPGCSSHRPRSCAGIDDRTAS
jgi:hypothetical protein